MSTGSGQAVAVSASRSVYPIVATKEQFYRTGVYAGFVTRAIAFIVDLFVTTAILAVTFFVGKMLTDMFSFNELSNKILVVSGAIAQVTFPLLYYIFFWVLAGQTPGKVLMGIRITHVDADAAEGSRPKTRMRMVGGWQGISIGRALVRLLIGYPVSAILFLGFLWVLVDPKRKGFHDKLAGTSVIFVQPEEAIQPSTQSYSALH